jgi:penicillin-binding protein 1C
VALANSRNVPAVNLLRLLGLARERAFLSELGLDGEGTAAARAGLGLAIGGVPTTLEQAVRAYTLFPCGGLAGDLVWWRAGAGAANPPTALLSPETARQITLFLSDPQARLPSFPRMGTTEYPFPVAVKTGTSTNYRDAWTVAWSRRFLVGAWVGRPDGRAMERLSGAISAAELTRDLMLELQPREAGGLEDLSFPPPARYLARRVCALTGNLATPACPQVFEEWFPPGREPVDGCGAHRRVLTDGRTGRPATSRTPVRELVVRSYIELAPQYAAWAAAARLPRSPSSPSRPGDRRAEPAIGSYLHDPSGGLAGGDGRVRLRVTQPESGVRLLRDPETPPELATVALQAVVDPPTSQVVWYVDGAPYTTAAYPYTARWPIAPGEHVIEARLANANVVSNRVTIRVE